MANGITTTEGRYQVYPIATEDCDSVDRAVVILGTDDISAAKDAAGHANYPFGAGILDTQTGLLDVGFGFGVPCPAIEE